MREVPDCLTRRYKALDELIRELNCVISKHNSTTSRPDLKESSEDVGIKLMCEFWDILKEDPNYNLSQAIQERMGLTSKSKEGFNRPQRITCYMAAHNCLNKDDDKKKKDNRDALRKIKNLCCQSETSESDSKSKCCGAKSVSPSMGSDALPLSKVLCNLKEAASYDKKCNERIKDLMEAGKQLQNQIEHLEHREKEGIQMLKKADCMWTCMEDAYKKKVAESLERQKSLLAQLKEVETSTSKWRKNKRDLELALENVNKCQQEMTEKLNQKTNDMKIINMEITNFQTRVDYNKKEIEAVKKSVSGKKQTNDVKIVGIGTEVKRLEKLVQEEYKIKQRKEKEGTNFVKEAREDLQKLCKVLLQKKLENEDLRAERQALLEEIDLLKISCDQCQDKCKQKQKYIADELLKVDKEIAEFKLRCTKCHQCIDTTDARKFCTDCPKCMGERDCMYESDHCSRDPTMDCVCMSVKQKFLNNIFDNMYTVLEKQIRTCPGKAVAETVLQCLKRSRNGKLNEETRNILQDFILATVKKNLNLTIVGGAVKTRCELDSETYKQLTLCLKQVKVKKPSKQDKGTIAKKDPCRRWGGDGECNCPKGPKACICTKKAPPPPNDPTPCPPASEDKEDKGEVKACPHKENTACGPDCAMHAVPSSVGADIATWKPDPCKGNTCTFSKSMRAAQCMLGPESLSSVMKSNYKTTAPYVPDIREWENPVTCKCGTLPINSCTCRTPDKKHLKAGYMSECDGSNCDHVWNCLEDEESFQGSSLKERDSIYNLHDTYQRDISIHKIPSVQTEILMKAQQEIGTESHLPMKLSINEAQQLNSNSTDLHTKKKSGSTKDMNNKVSDRGIGRVLSYNTKINSGNLTINLDEQTITKIHMKINEDPNLIVFLKKNSPGSYEVDFNSLSDERNTDVKRISVKRTSSGNLFFKMFKDVISISQHGLIHSRPNEIKKALESSILLDITKQKRSVQKADDFMKEVSNVNFINKEIHRSNLDNYEEESINIINNNRKMLISAEREDESFQTLPSASKRTSSGIVVIDIKSRSSSIKNMLLDIQNQSILALKPSSGKFVTNPKYNVDSERPNTILQKSLSGEITIITKDTVLKEDNAKNKLIPTKQDQFYKVKMRNNESEIMEPSALLRLTASDNYIIVMDKEFENRYRHRIEDYIGRNGQCYVGLTKTVSDTYLINLCNNDMVKKSTKSYLLTRRLSGTVKIHVNDEIDDNSSSYKSLSPGSSKAFGGFLKSRPSYSNECCGEMITKNKLLDSKSSSDTNLYDKVKLRLKDDQCPLSKPSFALQKTASGQYAIVLNKQSKKTFINNLKKYLTNSSHGIVPIKKTQSGEITISFSDSDEGKGYGSLKITPSGNIYILIDENMVKGIEEKVVEKDEREESLTLKEIISKHGHKVKCNIDKSVTTTCNAKPDDDCDASKCVCKELRYLKNQWDKKKVQSPSKTNTQRHIERVKSRKASANTSNIFDINKHKENCSTKTKKKGDNSNEISPHIVIKPCRCHPLSEKMSSSTDQHFFVIDAICPIHKDRYKSVSNEIIEITGLCNNPKKYISKQETTSQNKTQEFKPSRSQSKWDSLSFLPPQLPAFLRDVTYKKN